MEKQSKFILKILFMFIAIAFAWYSCTFLMVGLHEAVHQEIFKSDGIESRIEFRGFLGLEAVTIGSSGCKTEECKLAHNINEAISYNIYAFMFAFWLGLFILLFFLELKRYEDVK